MPLPAVIHCTISRSHLALVAQAVAVFNGAGENIGDGLDTAVRMPRKSCAIVVRVVVAKIIQQQKWIELFRLAEPEGALQFDARALNGRCGLNNLFYWAE
jgi:NAD(P)H-hydrate repair Nnr-like enzyme with NAD(P)H-hydrate epimerase domain